MAQSQPFGATNENGTCLWCGRKLRTFGPDAKPTKATLERQEGFYGEQMKAQERQQENERQERVAKHGQRKGDYGDGYFCGLRCGYEFGVAYAGFGRRLQPAKPDTNGSEGGVE